MSNVGAVLGAVDKLFYLLNGLATRLLGYGSRFFPPTVLVHAGWVLGNVNGNAAKVAVRPPGRLLHHLRGPIGVHLGHRRAVLTLTDVFLVGTRSVFN